MLHHLEAEQPGLEGYYGVIAIAAAILVSTDEHEAMRRSRHVVDGFAEELADIVEAVDFLHGPLDVCAVSLRMRDKLEDVTRTGADLCEETLHARRTLIGLECARR